MGSTRLSRDAKSALDEVAVWAKDAPTRSVRLRGQTDSTGNAAANAKLSERRADAVKSYLARRGVDPARMTTSGQAQGDFVAENENRRAVEVTTCSVAPVAAAPPEPAAPVAAEPPQPMPPPTTIVIERPAEPALPPAAAPMIMAPKSDLPTTTIGVGAMVGGGVVGFVDNQTRAFADTGGSWEARVSAGTRTPFAFEAAYIGSAQGISSLGLTDAKLLGNGAEGTLRLNLTRKMVQPYLFGGAGWTHYQVITSGNNTSSFRNNDDVLTVPFGAGISVRLSQGMLMDVRATGRAAFYEDLMGATYADTGQDARLHTWNAGARLGWEF
jgi:OmpA family